MIARTQEEIDAQIDQATAGELRGSRWPGLTYEEGVVEALMWVTGQSNEAPMEDE